MRKLTTVVLGLVSIGLLASHAAAVQDCNGNGVPDVDDIDDGTSADVNANAIPDECERCAVNESFKLTASDAAFNDRFAFDVALDAETALIGVPRSDIQAFDGGAAYFYRFDGSDWIEEAQLTAFDAYGLDHFGTAVALSGDVAVVGAPDDDDAGSSSGAAYVFRFDGSDWVFETKLVAASAAAGDSFGTELLVAGDVIVVAAPGSGAAVANAGAVFVFRFDGVEWIEEAELTASDAASGDGFGRSLSLADSVLLVAAPRDDDGGTGTGSVYVFRMAQNQWAEETKLTASDASAGDAFGTSVALTAEYALIGAPFVDDMGPSAGAVYCFGYDGSNWVEHTRIVPHDLVPGARFGNALAAEADLAVIAAAGDGDAAPVAGAAYAYVFDGSNWIALAKFTASDAAFDDGLANSVAVSGSTALVAAWQNDDAGFASGSAYMYHGLSDCNANDALDICDIADGVSADCDANDVPDECQPDSDGDGVIDPCDACPDTPAGGEVSGDGCLVADPVEDMELESVCSDEPDLARRWKVRNPNAIDIEITWELGGSEQHGRFMAPPGEFFFRTETVRGVNSVKVTWMDELNRERDAVEESGGMTCDNADSDGDGVANQDDWCPDTPEGKAVDQHGCARKQKVELCHLPPGNSDNRHDIRVKPAAVEAHLAHGDFIGGCDQAEPEHDEDDEGDDKKDRHGERDDKKGRGHDRDSEHDDDPADDKKDEHGERQDDRRGKKDSRDDRGSKHDDDETNDESGGDEADDEGDGGSDQRSSDEADDQGDDEGDDGSDVEAADGGDDGGDDEAGQDDPISPPGPHDRSEQFDVAMPVECGMGLLGMLPLMFAGLAGARGRRPRRSTVLTERCLGPRTLGD